MTITSGNFMESVHEDLVSGYEQQHPEVGSIKEKEHQIASARRYELLWGLTFGMNVFVLGSFIIGFVLMTMDGPVRSVAMVYDVFGIIVALVGYVFTLRKLLWADEQRRLLRKEAASFRQSLEKLRSCAWSNSETEKYWFYDESNVWTSLFLTARDILLAKAKFKRMCKDVDNETEERITISGSNVMHIERMFEEAFDTANNEFRLGLDKKQIFSLAAKSLGEES